VTVPSRQPNNEEYEFGPFRVGVAERLLSKDQRTIPLTPKAFDALVVLVRNRGRVVEKDELLKEVWPDTFVEEGVLAVNVAAIRKALSDGEEGPSYIETVPRRGYRFIGEAQQERQVSEARGAESTLRTMSGSVPRGLAFGFLALILAGLGWYVSRPRPGSIPPPSPPIPLTSTV
jgi:DNA-binding winged helix-turn-helix (wHTH) protein